MGDGLTWQQDCKLTYDYHVSRVGANGKYINNGKGKKIGWSIRDTAKELNQSPSTISRKIKLAQGLKLHPFLYNYEEMKDAEQALKALVGLKK